MIFTTEVNQSKLTSWTLSLSYAAVKPKQSVVVISSITVKHALKQSIMLKVLYK